MEFVAKWRIGNRDEIYSPSINSKGYLNDRHGINSFEKSPTKFPSLSFPIWWKKINGAKSYAIMMESYDSTKSIGFPFINWVAVNINQNEITENQSVLDWVKWQGTKERKFPKNILWQGHNSTCSVPFLKGTSRENKKVNNSIITSNNEFESCLYFGPSPRLCDSLYVIRVYGLDVPASELSYIESYDPLVIKKMDEPFFVGDFMKAITNHTVGTWTLSFKYRKADDPKKINEVVEALPVEKKCKKKI